MGRTTSLALSHPVAESNPGQSPADDATATRSDGAAADDDVAPATADDSSSAGPEEGPPAVEPDLMALLEQLSATIDEANHALAESPRLSVRRVDADAGPQDEAAPTASMRTQALPRPRRRRRLIVGAVAAAALISAAGAGALWLRTDPGLIDRAATAGLSILAALEAHDEEPEPSAEQRPKDEARLPAPELPQPAKEAEIAPPVQVAAMAPAATEPAPPAIPAAVPGPLTPLQTAEPLEPARGPAGQPIKLGLILPQHEAGDQISVMVREVPREAELTAGARIGGGTWILEEKDLAGLALVTPASFAPGAYTLDVALVRSDGKIPQKRSIDVVVEPAHAPVTPVTHGFAAVDAGKAPPPAAPADPATRGPAPGGPAPGIDLPQEAPAAPAALASLSKEEEARFLARAEALLKLGDVAGARLVLEHAARRGNRPAMLALAKTYDPEQLAKLGIRGVQADMDQAVAWYERASRKADR